MNEQTFTKWIEAFGEMMRIPKRDVLMAAQDVILGSRQQPEEMRSEYLYDALGQYMKGFKEPLPEGTRSILERFDEEDENE